MERQVTAVREAGLRCRVRAGEHEFVVDEPASVGGTDQGPQPTDMLLGAVASCFTIALSYCAARRGLAPDPVRVEVTGTYDGPRFRSITVSAVVGGVSPDELARLTAEAERVCYVTNTLRGGPEIEVRTSVADGGTGR
ncbi:MULTISPECIES: OsmC family protein [Pseudonocardia]|uniref:OsmC-like protein n=2 Tax=Pseudonocardia TaxID=1847 RepID=A0A1Y2N7P1_PSEAH|nr:MULTISPECIES: OsmC family protein [Pseudonocardia]OSY43473.1 OsmC-like protein [Pseudonocardia autotrophica]TDN73533.1 putative OsmC-like protein [Pseudonocardia autotrophica]BBG04276.1 hypothetical protein Pdca_54850 [Pseudonocardia autotrophica]GEC25581.1 hypothetical protein PSA01_26100 [Pseudonocardia saturnea]